MTKNFIIDSIVHYKVFFTSETFNQAQAVSILKISCCCSSPDWSTTRTSASRFKVQKFTEQTNKLPGCHHSLSAINGVRGVCADHVDTSVFMESFKITYN